MMNLELQGMDKIRAALLQLAQEKPKEAGRALYLEANQIMTRAKRDFVPVDLGALRRSGNVQVQRSDGIITIVRLSFGDDASPYALAVHEHPSAYSPPSWKNATVKFSPSGHGPKYLQTPFTQAMDGMLERLAYRMARL